MADCRRISADAGFSLLEAVVALSVSAVAFVALAELFTLATISNVRARHTTVTTLLAADKIEQFRALAFSLELTDPALEPSPPGTLDSNLEGYCDFLDEAGRVISAGSVPAEARYVRRWSIDALPVHPANMVLVQVLVTRIGDFSEARLVMARSRKAR